MRTARYRGLGVNQGLAQDAFDADGRRERRERDALLSSICFDI